jgi:predicted transcriptional regulator
MTPHHLIFGECDAEADARSLAEAEADIAAGRLIPNEEVMKWVLTWGTPEEGPPPESWGLD